MKKELHLLVVFIFAIVLTAVIIPIGSISFAWKSIAALLSFGSLTFYCLQRTHTGQRTKKVLVLIVFPPLSVYLFIHISSFNDTLVALPSSCAHIFGVVFGCVAFWTRRNQKVWMFSLTVIGVLYSFLGNSWWGNWTQYRNVELLVFGPGSKVVFTTSAQQNITSDVLRHRIVVLDFWNTGCGECFKKFPLLEELYYQWSSDSLVEIYSVNVPLKRDSVGQGEHVIQSSGYHFPVVYCSNEQFIECFGLNSFPSILIIVDGQSVEPWYAVETLSGRIEDLRSDLN